MQKRLWHHPEGKGRSHLLDRIQTASTANLFHIASIRLRRLFLLAAF